MLKLAGETGTIKEKIQIINYSPGLQDTFDLESGIHTIVPTTRPPIGSAQYSCVLTLPAPADARLAVKRIATRLNINIAGLGTATTVYCSVRVDADDTDHELFNLSWTSTGSKYAVIDVHPAYKSAIFNLLRDGSAHTFYFLFWADAANQASIDVVRLWEAVGVSGMNEYGCLELTHEGLFAISDIPGTVGTGAYNQASARDDSGSDMHRYHVHSAGRYYHNDTLAMSDGRVYMRIFGTVATDLNYIGYITFWLRSEQ